MSPSHRKPPAVSRRQVLGLAGLAALPAGAFTVQQLRSRDTPVVAGDTTPSAPSASPSASPSRSATPVYPAGGGGPVRFRPGKVMLGAYLALEGKTAPQAQSLRRHQLGRTERIAHVFYDWTDTLPTRIDGIPDRAVAMISWRGTTLAGILNGTHDRTIARAAQSISAIGRPTFLRWGWEMNGSWYAWGGYRNGRTAAGYVQAWRYLHDRFRAEGVDNVSWVWSPNWNDSPAEAWNRMARYYPGDQYVDWVGISGYNLHQETPDTLFSSFYRTYADRKPIMIAEVGSVDRGGSTKGEWITLFADWVQAHPAVGAVAWFDTDTHYGYSEKWRIDTDATSLAAYRAMAKNPWFAG